MASHGFTATLGETAYTETIDDAKRDRIEEALHQAEHHLHLVGKLEEEAEHHKRTHDIDGCKVALLHASEHMRAATLLQEKAENLKLRAGQEFERTDSEVKKQQKEKEEERQMEIAVKSTVEQLQALQREKERQTQQLSRLKPDKNHKFVALDRRVVVLNSAPSLSFEKPGWPKLGRTKRLGLHSMKVADAKIAAEGVMSTLDPNSKPRYARSVRFNRVPGSKGTLPTIEVLEALGQTVLGVPNTSTLQQFATTKGKIEGVSRQILIAIHSVKPHRGNGGGGGKNGGQEADAASIRSGAAVLNKSLFGLREALAESRNMHNMFNETPKYAIGM